MTEASSGRRAELIAAAVADELTAAEAAELDRIRIDDPGVDSEIESLRGVAASIASAPSWTDVTATPGLRDRITRSLKAQSESESATAADIAPVTSLADRRMRRPWLLALGAAACVAIGMLGGTLIPGGDEPRIDGPPGTLGAIEHVSFTGEPSGVDIEGDLVAHTWGTETVLLIDGLDVGADYTVVVTDRSGREVSSGSFIGSDAVIDCRMNAAVLREDVTSVAVLDTDGGEVAKAQVPPVGS